MGHRARHGQAERRVAAGAVALALVAGACASGGADVAFDQRAAVLEGSAPAAIDDPATAELQAGGLIGGRATEVGGARVTAGDAASTATVPGRKGVLKIGTVLPLTGGQREFGEPVLRVTQAFVDEVNATGGLAGYELKLIAYDACLTCQDAALAAVKRLVEQDGVFALVNTYVMVIAFIPVIPYIDAKRVPLIQGGSEEMTSDSLSPVTFATAPPGLFYGRFIPTIVKDHMKVRRVGITYLNVPTEAEAIPKLKEELAKDGIEVVAEEPIEAAEEAVTSMDSAVTRMRLAGAEGVVATNPVLLATGRPAADRQGWHAPWFGPAAWSKLLEDACGVTCDDVVFTDTAGLSYTDRATPQMRQFHEVLDRRYAEGARTGHELAAWVAMQLFSEVVARSGADAERFIAEMEGVRNLDLGTTSPLTFSPDRHMGGSQTVILKLKGGRYVPASGPVNYGYSSP